MTGRKPSKPVGSVPNDEDANQRKAQILESETSFWASAHAELSSSCTRANSKQPQCSSIGLKCPKLKPIYRIPPLSRYLPSKCPLSFRTTIGLFPGCSQDLVTRVASVERGFSAWSNHENPMPTAPKRTDQPIEEPAPGASRNLPQRAFSAPQKSCDWGSHHSQVTGLQLTN